MEVEGGRKKKEEKIRGMAQQLVGGWAAELIKPERFESQSPLLTGHLTA